MADSSDATVGAVAPRSQPSRALTPIALGLLALLAVIGLFAILSGESDTKRVDLGIALVSGAIIGGSILAAQYSLNARDRYLENLIADSEKRQNLIHTIGMSTDMSGIDLSGMHLDGVYLRGKRLDGANLIGTSLRNADLTDASLKDALLIGTDLRGAILAGTDFTGAIMYAADLSESTTRPGTVWLRPDEPASSESKIQHLDDDEARRLADQIGYAGPLDEARTWFEQLVVRRATFDRALLLGAILDRAELIGASFEKADLSGCSMNEANLALADLSNARVRKEVTDSRATRVERTMRRFPSARARERLNLVYDDPDTEQHLAGVQLPTPDLTGVRLNAASLRGTEFAPEAKLDEAHPAEVFADKKTRWPEHLPPAPLSVRWADR